MSYRWPVSLLCVLTLLVPGAGSARAGPTNISTTTQWLQGWPMVGHDPQRTNRSPAMGPLHPRLLFTHSHIYSQPLVGRDNTVYGWSDGGLFALGRGNRPRWVYPSSEGDAGGPAALRPDGTLVAVGYPPHIPGPSPTLAREFAIAPSGHLAWGIGAEYFSKGVAPFVTAGGVFYVPFVGPLSGKLDILSKRGAVLTRFHTGSFYSVARAPDGTIEAFLKDEGLVSLDAHGSVVWQRDLGISDAPNLPLLVGQHGTVYAATSSGVVAYDAHGGLVWRKDVGSQMLALAETSDGSLLGIDGHSLTKFDLSGRVLWTTTMGPSSAVEPPALIVDARGTAYAASADGVVRIIQSDGAQVTRLTIGKLEPYVKPALALGPTGRLLVRGGHSTLYVYGE